MFVRIIVLLVLVNVYFITHIFIGENCIQAYLRNKKDVASKQEILNDIIAERHELERILMQKHIDKDLLEEIVRKNMNLTSSNEVIILQK